MDNEMLAVYGVDYKSGLARCTNDAAFYRKLLAMFLQDECFPRGAAAYEKKDWKGLFAAMHELKGTSGNLALTELYAAVCILVELLRGGDVPAERVDEAYGDVERAYGKAMEGLRLFCGQE